MFPYRDISIAVGNTAMEFVIIPAEIIKQLRARCLLGIYTTEAKLEFFVRSNARIPSVMYWGEYSIRVSVVDTFDDSDIRSVVITLKRDWVKKDKKWP